MKSSKPDTMVKRESESLRHFKKEEPKENHSYLRKRFHKHAKDGGVHCIKLKILKRMYAHRLIL